MISCYLTPHTHAARVFQSPHSLAGSLWCNWSYPDWQEFGSFGVELLFFFSRPGSTGVQTWRYAGVTAVPSGRDWALIVNVRSMRPLSSDILYLPGARIPSILLPPNWMGFGMFWMCSRMPACKRHWGHHTGSAQGLRSVTCSAADCAYGRGVTRAVERALGMTISYFGQEPNPLSTRSTHVLWDFAPCTRWQSYMARQCRPSFPWEQMV